MTTSPAPTAIRVALMGAAGLAGEAVVRALEERKFPVAELTLLGGGKALGRTLEFHGEAVGVAANPVCLMRNKGSAGHGAKGTPMHSTVVRPSPTPLVRHSLTAPARRPH